MRVPEDAKIMIVHDCFYDLRADSMDAKVVGSHRRTRSASPATRDCNDMALEAGSVAPPTVKVTEDFDVLGITSPGAESTGSTEDVESVDLTSESSDSDSPGRWADEDNSENVSEVETVEHEIQSLWQTQKGDTYTVTVGKRLKPFWLSLAERGQRPHCLVSQNHGSEVINSRELKALQSRVINCSEFRALQSRLKRKDIQIAVPLQSNLPVAVLVMGKSGRQGEVLQRAADKVFTILRGLDWSGPSFCEAFYEGDQVDIKATKDISHSNH